MSRAFEKELATLRERLDEMADLVQAMITDAIDALVRREPARRGVAAPQGPVLEKERRVNQLEMEIDDRAWKMIALRQPMGSDLRFILCAIKVNSVLERIGDEAVNIAGRVAALLALPELKPLIDIPRMAGLVTAAVATGIRVLHDYDEDDARELCLNDQTVDHLRDQVVRELITYMQDRPENVVRALDLIFVAKSLERIGDQATNIAEDAIYLYQGIDIRHHAVSDEEFKKRKRPARK